MAATDMPYLKHVNLQVAGPVGPQDGTLRWRRDEAMICEWLPTYEPPTSSSCAYLPWISVGEQGSGFLRLFGTRACDTKLVYEEVEISDDDDE